LLERRRALTLVGESDRKLVKLAMKHAPQETIKQRTVPTEVVNAVIQELKDMQDEVREVMREEREEKEVRLPHHSCTLFRARQLIQNGMIGATVVQKG
jgi:ATP-dependent RNA helicase DDX27